MKETDYVYKVLTIGLTVVGCLLFWGLLDLLGG